MTNLVINVPGEYVSLGLVMQSALEQASKGKGRERHASEGEAYEDQIICEVARRVGLGYPLGQAVKKIYESQRLILQLGVQELLGAMNYLAAAVIVMQERMEEEGRRFREDFSHVECERCQNGNDHSSEFSVEPEFKPGDRVEFVTSTGETSHGEFVRSVVFADGTTGHLLSNRQGRFTVTDKAVCHRGSDTEKPEFKPGDRVLAKSPSTGAFIPAEYVQPHPNGCGHVVKNGGFGIFTVDLDAVMPAPKAEGCEALVEKDAPRTKEELMQRIVDCNPSVYPRTPTGEELAEKAEEEKRG